MPFIHSIRYEESKDTKAAAATASPIAHLTAPACPQRIRLRFWAAADEQLHTIDLHVAKHSDAAVFVCPRIDCSLAPLQPSMQQLLLSSTLGSGSSAYLFRLVESVVRLLRDQTRVHRPLSAGGESLASLTARGFASILRSDAPATILAKSVAFDVYLTLLASAAHSGRSCTLVNPVPPSCRSLTATAAAEGEQDAAIARVQTALQQLPPLVPLCLRTASLQQDDAALAALHASVPVAALSLLNDAARVVDLMNLRCFDEQLHSSASSASSSSAVSSPRRWFQFDNDDGLNLSCPAPHWVLDVELHDPHFDELVHAQPADDAASSSAGQSQVLQVYHGSPLANWHSILHRGLQNHSGTKHQSSGALFGQGVYFSDDLRVARNFSRAGPNPLHGDARTGASMLGARVEVVGVYDLLIPAVPTASAGLASASLVAPVRRAPPRELSSGADDVPDNYFVVSDLRYACLKHLLIWRADGQRPGRIDSSAMESGKTTLSPVAVAGLPRLLVAQQSPVRPPLMHRSLHWLRSLFSGSSVIVAYALVLLAIGLAQVDWQRTRRIAEHWWRVQAGKRF